MVFLSPLSRPSSPSPSPPFSFTKTSRTELIAALLTDINAAGPKARLSSKEVAPALLAVKTLGKDPAGSAFLASPANLSTLLAIANAYKDDHEAWSEALRCIANALLLIEAARSTFIGKQVNGADACLLMLDKATAADQVFILSRILFLSTAAGPSYVESIIDGKFHGRSVIDILSSKLELVNTSIRNNASLAKEAMADLLKFIFNLLVHYPKLVDAEPVSAHAGMDDTKVMGDYWSPKLDGLLAPLLRVFVSLPATSPAPILAPMTHIIHALITIPITPSLKPIWLRQPSSSGRSSSANSPQGSNTPRFYSRKSKPFAYTAVPSPPKLSTLDRALSVISAGRRSLSSRNASPTSSSPSYDIPQRAWDLLDGAFAHYFPDKVEVDDSTVRNRAKTELSNDSLDDVLSPLVVLITRICIGDVDTRARARQWIVPDDLDRSSPLEERPDLLGRCLRLLASVYHPRLKDAVGEMLYAISDSNGTLPLFFTYASSANVVNTSNNLSALFGYGNVAGFLFHKGVLSAPTPSDAEPSNAPSSTSSGTAINPITGQIDRPKQDLPEMSDEEKEREMEKLFVLFDRLEKTGALPPEQNPIRQGIQSGKLPI